VIKANLNPRSPLNGSISSLSESGNGAAFKECSMTLRVPKYVCVSVGEQERKTHLNKAHKGVYYWERYSLLHIKRAILPSEMIRQTHKNLNTVGNFFFNQTPLGT